MWQWQCSALSGLHAAAAVAATQVLPQLHSRCTCHSCTVTRCVCKQLTRGPHLRSIQAPVWCSTCCALSYVLPAFAAAAPCRNWVLATNTLQAAQISAHNALGSPVVAIVGKGHIPGMVYVIESVVNVFAQAHGSGMQLEATAAE